MTSNPNPRWYQFSLRTRVTAAIPVAGLLIGRVIYQNTATGVSNPDKVILYSLDYREEYEWKGFPEAKETFHDIPVLGRVEIDDPAKRKEIITALNAAKAEGDQGAKCFYPRHGIRVVENGREVDHLICFECKWLQIYLNGFAKSDLVQISRRPQPVFNKYLREANVPISLEALGEEDRPK